MSTDEIRETFLDYFAQRDHKRLRSGSLVPADFDPSVLLTTAGMHPLKAYFQGRERPPHPRLTSCQKCFRTVDIENVGNTTRHLTMFEMLGNFSIGDYFKRGAVEYAWDLSLDVFGFDPEQIWITVFQGDDELGVGPDEEVIEAWLSVGVPRERIVGLGREDNFWQSGPTGPCGANSELYLDRGLAFGTAEDLPGGDNERFLEYWNLVFMEYNQDPPGRLIALPAQNIDTGLGLDRMAAIQQGVPSVFETDRFAPLIGLGTELSGVRYGADPQSDRSLRILADHGRGMTFLVADGVTPSNEGRGYVLRRVMRRAILHGRRLGMEPGFLTGYGTVVRELMGATYPELGEQRAAIEEWLRAEEESFGHTLEQGTRQLEDLIARVRDARAEGIAAEDAFRLHDTYGFPIDLTLELVAEHGLGVDEEGFELLMEGQRTRARSAVRGGITVDALRERARALAGEAGFTSEFTGYATTEQETTVGALGREDGDGGGLLLVKLLESPFYATGGGQVADGGEVACAAGDCVAEVQDVLRLGGDQVLLVRPRSGTGALAPGTRVHARVDGAARHATEANHTATHLLHAALRTRLGDHVRQAGSYVGPDKLRFDFTHGHALGAEDVRWVEDEVNRRIAEHGQVRALTTTLDEARALGAMALFGEKYGDIVRMVEVGDGFSRELCGGTHVRTTAEIGAFKILVETSSAANVRRIEALTGPAAVTLLRARESELSEIARVLRTTPEGALHAVEQREARRRELEQALREGATAAAAKSDGASVEDLVAHAQDVAGARVLVADVPGADPDALLALTDKLKGALGDAVIVLGSATDGKVSFVAAVAPALVARGVRAGEVVRVAALLTGGGGGGRDTMARAGGREPHKLETALDAARAAVAAALEG